LSLAWITFSAMATIAALPRMVMVFEVLFAVTRGRAVIPAPWKSPVSSVCSSVTSAFETWKTWITCSS